MGNNNLDNWDKYSSNFLKADDVKNEQDAYVCIAVEEADDDIPKIRITLEREERDYSFDLNKTNIAKLKELGIKSPKGIIGKKLYFKKVLARNPVTNKEVDSLRIYKVD
jgi:hypothetical protein